MKATNKLFLTLGMGALALGFGSCVDDLDVSPSDPKTINPGTFAEDPEAYMDQVMGDVYLQYATHGVNNDAAVKGFDGGMSTFQRAAFIFEEIPTDESNWIPADADYGTIQYGICSASNRAILGVYSRFMICIGVCNDFIQTVNANLFSISDPKLQKKAQEYVRQAKILRSGAYFYLTDIYGNVPYADDNVSIGSVPPQLSRAEIVKYVTETLEDVVADYKENNLLQDPDLIEYGFPAYGYVSLDAAEALLVKYYLNYEVYTGTPAWDKCFQHAQAIIDRHKGGGFNGSGLAESYLPLFGANNQRYAMYGSADNEILWTIPQDATNLKSWANSTFMINAYIGETPADASPDSWQCHKADYNANDAWKCMTARKQFVEQFDWLDEEMSVCADDRVSIWKTSADNFNWSDNVLDQAHYGTNGYLPMKFSNFNYEADGSLSSVQPVATTQTGGDYPVIRLAEIYLSAAEAALHGAAAQSVALEYVNYIRERAYLDPWVGNELTLETLQAERCRELYCENCRRTDLIRYGKWISGYNWDWKNYRANGGDFPETYKLYPLPANFVSQAGYTQNPGY